MKIKEVMRKPVIIPPETTKAEIQKIVRKNPNEDLFIVVDKDGKFLGDIDENDLFYMILPNDKYSEIEGGLGFDLEKKFFAETAKEVMRRNPQCCYQDDEVMDVALDLAAADVNEMPVLDKDEKVVGVVDQGAILRKLEFK